MPEMNEVALTSALFRATLTEYIAHLLMKTMNRKHCRISQSFVQWPMGTKYNSNSESCHSVVCKYT